MAVLCEDISLLYFCVPKTASTACTQFLVDHAGGVDLPQLPDGKEPHWYWQYKHCSLRDLITHQQITRSQSGKLMKVATVRNPFDWVASRYNFERHMFDQAKSKEAQPWMQVYATALDFSSKTSFRDYVYHHYTGKKMSVLGDIGTGVDHVLRFERLEQDLKSVLVRQGYSGNTDIPEINVSPTRKRGQWKDLYDMSMMNVIEQCFEADFDRFGYSYEDDFSAG